MTNAFDEESWQALKIPEKSFAEKENLIITVGRLGTKQKNTEMLLEALKLTKLDSWQIALIGPIEPTFQSYLNHFFQENPTLKTSVVFTGAIYEKQQLWEYYNRAKVFVLTSEWESFGIVLTEACRFHNYILSTPVGNAEHIISASGQGEIIPVNDSVYLANTLQSIIDGTKEIIPHKPNIGSSLSYQAVVTLIAQKLSLGE